MTIRKKVIDYVALNNLRCTYIINHNKTVPALITFHVTMARLLYPPPALSRWCNRWPVESGCLHNHATIFYTR